MIEEQIKQKAEAEADKVIIGKGMDRTSVIHLKHLLVTMYVQGANSILSQLTEKDKQIEELKGLKDVATLIKANGSTTVTLMELNNHLVSANQKIKELEAQIEQKKKEEMEEIASALAYQRTVGVDNRIAELENKLANAEYQLEGRDLEIKELQESLVEWQKTCEAKSDTNSQLIEQLADKNEQIVKGRNIVHKLLVVIQRHKWWNYEAMDEARAFMSEVDCDKDHD